MSAAVRDGRAEVVRKERLADVREGVSTTEGVSLAERAGGDVPLSVFVPSDDCAVPGRAFKNAITVSVATVFPNLGITKNAFGGRSRKLCRAVGLRPLRESTHSDEPVYGV